jgi:hypothetical protein
MHTQKYFILRLESKNYPVMTSNQVHSSSKKEIRGFIINPIFLYFIHSCSQYVLTIYSVPAFVQGPVDKEVSKRDTVHDLVV